MFEYHVIPAPRRGKKAKGVKGTDGRFAHAMQDVLNEVAAEGWEYLRTDTLPSEERSGFTGRTTVYQNMLVFRRPVDTTSDEVAVEVEDAAPRVSEPPEVEENHAPSLPSAQDANQTGDNAPVIERQDA